MHPSLICVGLASIERIVLVDTMPARGSKGRARGLSERVGGIAAEAAIAARRLGAGVALLAPVGDDAVGREITAHLLSQGVDVTDITPVPQGCSASDVVLVDADGRRAIARYEDDSIQAAAPLPDILLPGGARAVLADFRWERGARHALAAARQHHIPALVVVGANDAIEPVCHAADHVLIDAARLPGHGGGANAATASLRLAEPVGSATRVTVDAGRVLLYAQGSLEEAAVPGFAPLDMSGAFAGAYTTAIAEGEPAATAARFAAVTAVLARSALEGGYKYPSRADVNAVLASLQ